MKKVNVKKVFGSELKELMRLLSSSGKECYIVGGAVRDLLLGYKKFKDIDEIINQWFPFRAGIYTKRRDYMLKKLQKELDIIKYKVILISWKSKIYNTLIDLNDCNEHKDNYIEED